MVMLLSYLLLSWSILSFLPHNIDFLSWHPYISFIVSFLCIWWYIKAVREGWRFRLFDIVGNTGLHIAWRGTSYDDVVFLTGNQVNKPCTNLWASIFFPVANIFTCLFMICCVYCILYWFSYHFGKPVRRTHTKLCNFLSVFLFANNFLSKWTPQS